MMKEFEKRVLKETQELANKLNKLHVFMAGDLFPKLDRVKKDLLYEQSRVMSEYLQILGMRLEDMGVEFTHEKEGLCLEDFEEIGQEIRTPVVGPLNPLNFGQALQLLKAGYKLQRSGWNGKGMFIVYQPGYPKGIACNENTAKAWGMNVGDLFKCEPYLQIRMVNGSHSMWTPSINDLLANDWRIVE